MTVPLPESFESNHSASWVALHFAIGLYVSKEATLGQAAEAAGLTQVEFQRELGKREIPINYALEDFLEDLETVRNFQRK